MGQFQVLSALFFALVPGLLALPRAEKPQEGGQVDAELEAAVRKAAGGAEVHGVGVAETVNSRFSDKDVTDWPKLVAALRGTKTLPVKAVVDRLSAKAEKLIADDDILAKLSKPLPPDKPFPPREVFELKSEVVSAFNEILTRSDFYQIATFKDLAIDDDARQLIVLGEKRTAWQTACLNWELLKATFPGTVANLPPNFRTVRVQVRAEKNVVLVLSGSNSCHWHVDVKPGSKVTGIILCGYDAQTVEVYENPAEAPILYRAFKDAKNIPRMIEKGGELVSKKSFGDYDPKREKWHEFVAGVKAATGKEFTSFQGGYRPGPKDEPYRIPPKK